MLNVFNLSLLLTVTRRSEQRFLMESVLIVQYNTIMHCDGVAVVKKNVKTIMCQEGGTLSLKEGCHLFDTKRFSQEQPHLNAAP